MVQDFDTLLREIERTTECSTNMANTEEVIDSLFVFMMTWQPCTEPVTMRLVKHTNIYGT
ncbi:MAG: hypothetical protein D6698_17615 [Gammaproteobacteria bacterium]|nr:MAG: hypothetical protein D6698_17615 [Gammaproteobacteria bacterium]